MRTNIDIDDKILKKFMKRSGAKTKREAVNSSLHTAYRLLEQGDAIRSLRGIGWDGDLESSRAGREFEPIA